MNNESNARGYDVVHPSSSERKRGVPWTEEEHRLFLLGLQKLGKGDWRGIARNFVITRTPLQVAAHAQKYFIRQSNNKRRRRRASLFDFTTDSKYTLEDVSSATSDFSNENLITEGALGKVYKGQGLFNHFVVVQRLDCRFGDGDVLQAEISTIKSFEHKNIAPFYSYCDEKNEKIIIYRALHGTLNQHLRDSALTWSHRLQICLGVARALNHIHYDIIHCDINSSKIILDLDWEPMIYGFELSTKYPQSWKHRLLFSRYFGTNNLTPKYDVYSFGVLLLEVLCGRKPMITNDGIQEDIDKIIYPNLRKQMDKEALALFKSIAYACLNQQHVQRPTMDQIVKDLEEVLELQKKNANLEHSKAADEGTSSHSLQIPLSEIRLATNNFNKAYFIGSGGYGEVYKAKLELSKISRTVAIKRIFSRADEQGKQGFLTEIELLTSCKHPNVVSLLGFCSEAREMILVYEYAFKGSLSDHLVGIGCETINLTWVQRIQICLDIANGINYLHTHMDEKPRILHRDIKSDNILLDENLKAKLADFGLSKFHPLNQQASSIYSKNIAGTKVYMDPEYLTTGKYKKESDIYSFGVVLFEVLSGSLAYASIYTDENDMGLAPIAKRRYNEGTLKELLDPKIIDEDDDHTFTLNRGPNQASFQTFSKVAYQCLADTQAKRPTIEVVIRELQNALHYQGDTMILSRFALCEIVSATENFAETYCIGSDNIGMVYKAELHHLGNNNSLASEGKNIGEPSNKRITAAIKRIIWSREGSQGKEGFFEELEMRASFKHPNIVSLLGFCDEGDERILVYEHVSERSLYDYLKSVDKLDSFTWTQRLHMCLEIARGLNHLHTNVDNPKRINIDIKSANILLDKDLGAKIAYFVNISKSHSAAYQEPDMNIKGKAEVRLFGVPLSGIYIDKFGTKSDIYSFGVVLFEIFCGRMADDLVYIKENDKGIAPIARQCFDDGTIQRLIDPTLKEEMGEEIFTSNGGHNKDSLDTFLKIAYECLGEAFKRPTMELVIMELESALKFHEPGEQYIGE